MRLNKNDITQRIEKISKQVEEISELKTQLSPMRVELLNRIRFAECLDGNFLKRFFLSYAIWGFYTHKDSIQNFNLFEFPKNYGGNEEDLNCVIGHEIMHNAQHSNFPDFILDLNHYGSWITDCKYFKSYLRLFEGDAEFISKSLKSEYYPNSKYAPSKMIKLFLPKTDEEVENVYEEGYKIIKREFGNDRKKINSLYNLRNKEILEIFGD